MNTKKKFLALGLATLLSAGGLRAQSIDQLIQQLHLDYQKLASLKTILQDLYTSYAVIDKGYTDIRNIAAGNFNLHKAFLDGLLAVSPTVRNYYRVYAIIDAEGSLVSEYKSAYHRWTASGLFSATELDYIGRAYAGLVKANTAGVDQLTMILTADVLRMSDAERMATIDEVYGDITGQLSALRQFNNSTALQLLQRQREANYVKLLKQLYGSPD